MTNDRFNKRVEVTVSVTPPFSLRWLNEFFRLKCAEDLIGLFPNPKEVTESMATFGALRKVKELDLMALYKRPDVVCLVPGDGTLPRTGAMVALRTAWNVISVDPAMRDSDVVSYGTSSIVNGKKYRRLECHWISVQDLEPIPCNVGIILAVHSHAPLQIAWDKLLTAEQKIAVALPCCTNQNIQEVPIYTQYQDAGVFSSKDRITIWRQET